MGNLAIAVFFALALRVTRFDGDGAMREDDQILTAFCLTPLLAIVAI